MQSRDKRYMGIDYPIKTVDLKRFYGKICALNGVSIKVNEGEIFGLLGPNGAGKTTLIRILTTLLLPTSGKAYVLGYDVEKEYREIRKRINMVSGGEEVGYGILTVQETLYLFSQFYGLPLKETRKRISELSDLLDLGPHLQKRVSRLSTGLRQRMNIARGFINNPDCIFLDEPTMGLDVESSINVRKFIKRWVKEKEGKTILLTTHNMYEAEELCDRIAIINKGEIFACDTPKGLKDLVKKEDIYEFEIKAKEYETKKIDDFYILEKKRLEGERFYIKIRAPKNIPFEKLIKEIRKDNTEIISFKKIEPTLEEVFVKLVGKSFEEVERE
ncbi:MAG: ATP-binding cassette domain-containing protein [Candidatus Hydrothermales bacterium]